MGVTTTNFDLFAVWVLELGVVFVVPKESENRVVL